jgi:hypothetical protein
MEGYLYVLFDAYANRCKIGRTRVAGAQRQRAIMGSYPVPTINALTARVSDYVAAETQCHRHFASRRANGEWFDVGIVEAVEYIHREIDWCELDLENLGAATHYIARARLATSHSGIGDRS